MKDTKTVPDVLERQGFRGDQLVASQSWKAPLLFFTEVAVGSVCFILIAIGAAALGFLMDQMKDFGVDSIIVGGLVLAKYGLFFVDLLLFSRFLWLTTSRAWGEL